MSSLRFKRYWLAVSMKLAVIVMLILTIILISPQINWGKLQFFDKDIYYGAQAYWYITEGDIYTWVGVSVYEGFGKYGEGKPPTGPPSKDHGFMMAIYRVNTNTEEELINAYAEGTLQQDVLNNGLNGASLNTTAAFWDEVSQSSIDISIYAYCFCSGQYAIISENK